MVFAMWGKRKNNRRQLYTDGKLKKFLDIVLSRYNDSEGIVGAYMYQADGSIEPSNEAEDVLKVARETLSKTFFSERVEPPTLAKEGGWSEDNYRSTPEWFQKIFKWEQLNKTNHIYESILQEIDTEEVIRQLKNIPLRKAPGPDNITPEMIKATPHEYIQILTDFMNSALISENIPATLKKFNVWCID
ncbi:MAG: hypothetical protein AABY31_02080, partial [Thermoproteota archaeon]